MWVLPVILLGPIVFVAFQSNRVQQWLHGGKSVAADTMVVHRLEDNPHNFKVIDSTVGLLRSGDMVLRAGSDATSYMLRQMNLKNSTYSHCGIVMIENGYPFVYHSIGGEDNPDSHLRRDSASFFFSPKTNERLGVARLDLTPAAIERLHGIVQRYYKAGVMFDMDFDLKTDDKLYCAEFVYKSVREAAQDTTLFSTTTVGTRTYVAVDNLFTSPHAQLICDYQFN